MNTDADWISDTSRLNRYVLQKHEDDHYGTLYTPRSRPHRNPDDDPMQLTARSTLTDLSLTNSFNASNTPNEESSVYCPSLEEVRR